MDARISTSPARARTDVPAVPSSGTPPIAPGTVRRLGLALTGGAAVWAASIFLYGTTSGGFAGRVGDLTGLVFQLGLFALLAVQMRTMATGATRVSRGMLKAEAVLLAPASVWSLLHGALPEAYQDDAWLAVLDVFWPLSMLGMFVIAVKIAVAGRWRGPLRWWPLLAESWVVVTLPVLAIFGDGVSRWVGGGHLLVGYAALGVLLARRPELTAPRG
ncbi:hypothetical protein ACFOWE_28825 [Planomonospora corallina]|uniref:Uncharacterized protein n=1 Tax=Planomonospora corallina TaxID=1806052 RepID=A0ABV8IDK8_9ACTN